MGAVGFVVRAEFRHRWRSWLALAVLVAVVGGLVLAAADAGRRTASAFPRYAATYGFDSLVYAPQPVPKLAKLPEVASVVSMETVANGTPTCACTHPLNLNSFSVFEVPPAELPHYAKLVAGKSLDQDDPHQVLASFSLEQAYGVHVGTVIRVPIYTTAQANDAVPPPHPGGPTQTVRVVGIEASEDAFPSVGTPNYEIIPTEAFARAVNPHTAAYDIYAVRLRHGAADLPRFDSDSMALGTYGTGDQEATATITAAIRPQAQGWWLLALLATMAGLATVAQALSRQAVVESETYRTLASVGLGPGTLTTLGMVRALVVGTAGAVGAVLLAFALSPLTPVGEARVAEPTTGFTFDALVLGLGALAIVVAVVLLGIWPALRAARGQARDATRAGRPAAIATRVAAAGAPPSAVIGVRRALERGHGRNAVPVGTALAGTVLAVAALCGTIVFGASLSHLTATPRLYGQAFDVWFNDFNPGPSGVDPVLSKLRAQPAVSAITLGTSGSVKVNGVATDAIAGQPLRGKLLISAVNGRLPLAAGEVALGVQTMRQAGTHVGSTVEVTVPLPKGAAQTARFVVVGTASFPPDFGVVGLNSGAIFTVAGYVDAHCASGPPQASCRAAAAKALTYVLLAGVKPGATGRATLARLEREFPQSALVPQTPTNLVNFGEAVNFPLILGAVLALFGAATLIHVLVVSVARRRRELGLLKALGFVRSQAAAAVCWQATTVALVGIVVGVPLGVAAGHAVWSAFATDLGVVPDVLVQAWVVAALALGVVVIANVLAIGPALVSARQHPSPLLRNE